MGDDRTISNGKRVVSYTYWYSHRVFIGAAMTPSSAQSVKVAREIVEKQIHKFCCEPALIADITAALNDEIEACANVAEIDCHHFFGQENCNACRTAAAIRSRKATR